MALRVFLDRDGHEWNVWRVRPSAGEDSPLHARYRDGWLCFQRVDGEGRCRMPLDEVPPGWDALPDERLDLLRRVAQQAAAEKVVDSTTEQARQAKAEDSARQIDSGPRQVAGWDGESEAKP